MVCARCHRFVLAGVKVSDPEGRTLVVGKGCARRYQPAQQQIEAPRVRIVSRARRRRANSQVDMFGAPV